MECLHESNHLSEAQVKVLAGGLNAGRVAKRRQGNSGPQLSYLEAWDVKAHLTRIFGYTGWSWVIESSEVLSHEAGTGNSGQNHSISMRLTGHLHVNGSIYSGTAVGSSSQPQVGEAMDMALKTADSDALKRAATMLGDQFGLSLYNDGSLAPVVIGILEPAQARLLAGESEKKDETAGEKKDGPAGEKPKRASRAKAPIEKPADEISPGKSEEFDPTPDESAAIGNVQEALGGEVIQVITEAEVEEWVGRLRSAAMNSTEEVITVANELRAAGLANEVFEGRTLGKIIEEATIFSGRRAAALAAGVTQ